VAHLQADLSNILVASRNEPSTDEVVTLSGRVLAKLTKIKSRENTFCAYCGKEMVNSLCTVCRKAHYCDRQCQEKAWKYHKAWCNVHARSA
jgi:hypothetical protein